MALSGIARPAAGFPLLNIMGAMMEGSVMAVAAREPSGMKPCVDMIMAAMASGFIAEAPPLVSNMGAAPASLTPLFGCCSIVTGILKGMMRCAVRRWIWLAQKV